MYGDSQFSDRPFPILSLRQTQQAHFRTALFEAFQYIKELPLRSSLPQGAGQESNQEGSRAGVNDRRLFLKQGVMRSKFPEKLNRGPREGPEELRRGGCLDRKALEPV